MTWTHKFLNCPQPPKEFIDLALSEDINRFGPKSPSNYYEPGKDPHKVRELTNNLSSTQVRIPRFDVPVEFRNWIIENISPAIDEASISISDPSEDGVLGPHTDRKRDFVLLYIVKKGGDKTRTYFWQEHGQPVIRDRITLVDDYSKLDLLDCVDFGEGQWVLLNGLVLHSVENIQTRRIAFQIAFDKDASSLEGFQ